MVRRACLLCVMLVALVGCGTVKHSPSDGRADPRSPANVPAGDAAALRADNAVFAGRLLAAVASGKEAVALSPFSISEALAMTFAGARGETARQIQQALDFRLPGARLHNAFNGVDQALATVSGPRVTLSIDNALYGQKGEPFRAAFLALVAGDYGAVMTVVDYAH